MRSPDDRLRSAADLRRLQEVSALFDYAELIAQYPVGPARDQDVRRLLREASQLRAVNFISRHERDRLIGILSCVMPAEAAVAAQPISA